MRTHAVVLFLISNLAFASAALAQATEQHHEYDLLKGDSAAAKTADAKAAEAKANEDSGGFFAKTRERTVMIAGASYQQIHYGPKDFYIRATRPGSGIVEVECQMPKAPSAPLEAPAQTPGAEFKDSHRVRTFIEQLEHGCAEKDGKQPERFTFEQSTGRHLQVPNSEKSESAAKGPSPGYPKDVDKRVIPDAVDASKEFPRYGQ